MPITLDIREKVEKQVEEKKKQLIKDVRSSIEKGAREGAKKAVVDMKRFTDQYVKRYYKSYKPKVYKRNFNLRFTLLSSHVGRKAGDMTFIYGSDQYEYKPYAKSNPNMVFDSFMSGSRYSNAAVMAADSKHFGPNIVTFKPESRGGAEILADTWNSMLFQDFLKKIQKTYEKNLPNYILKYLQTQWSL